MGMSKLEPAPLRIAISLPALLALRQRQGVRPSDRFLVPTQRLGHGFPRGDDYGGQDEVVRRSDQVLAGLTLRLRVSELDERGRRRADAVGFTAAFQDIVNGLARPHGIGANKDAFPA